MSNNGNGDAHATVVAMIQGVQNSIVKLQGQMDELSRAVGASVPLLEAMSRLNATRSNIVKEAVEQVFKLSKGQTDLPSRREHIVWPRQVAMYIMRERLKMTLESIGAAYGGKDHGTVMHACALVKGRIENNPRNRAEVETAERVLDIAFREKGIQ